jgi:hypothetical protein
MLNNKNNKNSICISCNACWECWWHFSNKLQFIYTWNDSYTAINAECKFAIFNISLFSTFSTHLLNNNNFLSLLLAIFGWIINQYASDKNAKKIIFCPTFELIMKGMQLHVSGSEIYEFCMHDEFNEIKMCVSVE